LFTIGHPQPCLPAAHPVKVIANTKNNNADIWFTFFIILLFLLYKKRAVLPVSEKINITILVAPLDWGLGHATRCIPIIQHLIYKGCTVIIATDGAQEKLLKTEFPQLRFEKLTGYNIQYVKYKRLFALKIILQLPKILISIKKEKKWLKNFVSSNNIDAVVSDNRYGLYNSNVQSVFITHQLLIKAPLPIMERVMQFFNYSLIDKFNQCWVPDMAEQLNLSGQLAHPGFLPKTPTRYLGGMSRFRKSEDTNKAFDLLVVISGPEPQRTTLENNLLSALRNFGGKAMLVRGLPASQEDLPSTSSLIIKNHLSAAEMEQAFIKSELIISRSGYTTVMDICKLQKKSILIPTPGQTEQEYLAKHLQSQGWCMAASQNNFDLQEQLKKAGNFQFKIPEINMEAYKAVLDEFLHNL
jgi:uncharacterized protein (TIGR00661 family)